jgi:hypothetical protein
LGEEYRSFSSSLCNFLHSPVISSLLGPNTLLNTLFSKTLSLRSSLNVSDQVSHPYLLLVKKNYAIGYRITAQESGTNSEDYAGIRRYIYDNTVRSESRCALRLRYVDLVQTSIDARGYYVQHLSYVHSDVPNADLQKVFANKIKRVQACIDAR